MSVWSKERFINKEDTNREDGRLSGAPNPSYCRTRLRVYKGVGRTGMQKCWWDKLQLGDPGGWPFMIKGHQHLIFLDSRLLFLKGFQHPSSGHVPILCFHRRWEGGLVFGAAGGERSLLCACLGCMTCALVYCL